jgi:hypothetical protein
VIRPTPLLDFFKRGEVPREARELAAHGALATGAYEQLAILVVLLDDPDADIRATAQETIDRIPVEALKGFLARSDVPIGLREFFADRGVFPAEIPPIELEDEPLVTAPAEAATADPSQPGAEASEAGDAKPTAPPVEEESRDSIVQQLQKMGFTERLKAAGKRTREMRAILIRDPNKMISAAVLSSPKLSESEVESFARMANVSEEVLRVIGNNRSWMKNYNVMHGLVKNAKTPLAMSMNLMGRLNERDLQMLSVDRNVPEPLRIAARKKVVASTTKR